MQTIKLTYPHEHSKKELPETIAAIGFFDGIHRGHEAVINKAVQLAIKEEKASAVISFYPHPSVVLQENITSVEYITTLEEKKAQLEALGVDRFYIIPFNKELSLLSPTDFINHYIIGLHIKHLIAGFDFTFGHKGKGNMMNIRAFQQGEFRVTALDKVEIDGEKASSTNIRAALAEGDLHQVSRILGRAYETTGTVIKGDQRGRELGFPTANLRIDKEKLLPRQGVYAVKILLDGQYYKGMANLGLNPTFKDDVVQPEAEVNLFEFNREIYGQVVTVYWYQFIRPEEKFNGASEIIEQMKDDEVQTRTFFDQKEAESK